MSMGYKLCIAALLASATFWIMQSNQNKMDASSPPQETLTIGTQSGYPPFEFMDSNGQIVGFDLDLAEQIAKRIGKKLVVKDMEFEGLLLSLKQRKIDLIMAGMDITPSREKEILMLPYHGEKTTALSLIFWETIPSGVNSLETFAKLPNAVLSFESGSTPELFMEKHPEIVTKSFQGTLGGLMDVKFGKSANLVEKSVAEYLQKKYSEIKILSIPLPPEDHLLGFGIGIKKDNQQLYEQVKNALDELKNSGELTQLENKWFKGHP